MSRAATAAKQAIKQNVKAISTQANKPFKPQQFLRFIYEPFPKPINCTTLRSTQDFAADPSHPFHIRAQRRLEAFDPTKLHWRVQCPLDVSKKGFIRTWAAKRVRNAIAKRLRESDAKRHDFAKRIEEGQGDANTVNNVLEIWDREHKLDGALLVTLVKDKLALTASKEQVEESTQWLLGRVAEIRKEALPKRRQQHKPSWTREREIERSNSLPTRHNGATDSSSRDIPSSGADVKQSSWPEDSTASQYSRRPRSTNADEIRAQVGYYFSDANLQYDAFLLGLIRGAENRPVPLQVVCGFKKMRRFEPYEAVKAALRHSRHVVLVRRRDEDMVVRRVPFLGSPGGEQSRFNGSHMSGLEETVSTHLL